MTDNDMIERDVRDIALDTLLERHPEARVAALGADGFRVPLPAGIGVPEDRHIPVPPDRATMVDLVTAADAMTVVTQWERALKHGVAIEKVHTRLAPDVPLTLTFIDARDRFGVWLAALTDADGATDTDRDEGAAEVLSVAVSPRTASVHKTAHAIITAIDDRTTRMLGWSAEQMVGMRSLDFYHPDDRDRAVANWMDMLSKRDSHRVRLRHQCADGSWRWLEFENVYQGADDVDDIVVVSHMSDISDEMAAHEAVRQREQLFRRLAESLPIGLLQVGVDGAPVYANARLSTILGVPMAATLDQQFATVDGRDRAALDAAFAELFDDGVDQRLELDIHMPHTGALRRCDLTLIKLTDEEGAPGALACFSDITDSARMREELRRKATFDDLTGCHNRASILALLDQALQDEEAGRQGSGLTGVIFIDLDGFKAVNDTHGHEAGDQVLVTAARTVTNMLRDRDAVGRIGGDEFLIVCPGLADAQQALAIAERVGASLRQAVALQAASVRLCASIGVACSGPGITSDALVARADVAMYASKARALGRPVLHGT